MFFLEQKIDNNNMLLSKLVDKDNFYIITIIALLGAT